MEITYQTHQSSMAKFLSQVRETTGLISDSAHHADNTDYPEENTQLSLECNSLREQGLPIRSSLANKHLRITSIEYHKVFHKTLPLCQKRKIPIKSKENMTVKNIPMADLSCSSPLPSADQVEIYVPHKKSTFQALCNIPHLPLTFLLSQCPLLSHSLSLLLKSVLTLRFYNLVMRNKN